MPMFKSVFGIARAVIPVLYCGGLLYYFLDDTSLKDADDLGLTPTLMGLGIVGLLFCIPLILKIVRLISRPPGSGGGSDTPDKEGFDADAVIARYMAQRSTETALNIPATRPTRNSGGPAGRTGFGRRTN